MNDYIGEVDENVVEKTAEDRLVVVGLLETKAAVWATERDAARILAFVEYAQNTDAENEEAAQLVLKAKALIEKLEVGQAKP
jgi:hypothetical protein